MIKGTTNDARLAEGVSLLNKLDAQQGRIKALEAKVKELEEALAEQTRRKEMFFKAYMDFVRGKRPC